MWAVEQTGENEYVKFLCSSAGFNIQFRANSSAAWQNTTWGNGGYKTKIKINDGAEQSICSSGFEFGKVFTVGGIQVSIDASIADATTKAVTIQYNIKNTNSYAVKLQIGSYADTQVGNDDYATITRIGNNTIMMTGSDGAMYGITAGTDEFTTLWYGYYYNAGSHVFIDNGGVYDYGDDGSLDSGLAWSWTINNLPAGGEKFITFGGLASQKGAVSMAGYKYGTTPSTPTVTGITGNPSITYYYNTYDSNAGGTPWSGITGTTLAVGKYYMYAYIGATSTSAAMTTSTTPFTIIKGDYDMSGVSFNSAIFGYDGHAHSLAITGSLPSGVSVSYVNNSRTNEGSQTVTANFSTSNSNYNTPASKTATLTITRATPQYSDFTFIPPSDLIYDATPKTATVNTTLPDGRTGMGAVTVKYYSGSTELSSPPVNVGTYTVKINLSQGQNYNSANGITASGWQFTILPREIASATITDADMTWTGGVLTKTQGATDGYTIKYKGNDLVLNTDFTIYTVPTTIQDAGSYSLYFTGLGNFTGTTVRAFNVKKDISSNVSINPSSLYQIVPEGSTSVAPVIEITDDANETVLIKGTDFDITPAVITADEITQVTITGLAPRYSGSFSVVIKGLKEYYTRSTSPNNNVFDIHLTGTTATGATAVLGNETHGAVIDPLSTGLKLPVSVTFASTGATIDITGIEDKAFTGCSSLRYIDATALADYTPSCLLRDIETSPFYGVPKQALVYLNGLDFAGENYVYYPGAGTEYYCDVFKVYDDLDGNQLGFEDADDYKWAFENRYAFKANTILNTRMLTGGQHYTTCLPYDLPIPEGMKAYTLNVTSSQLLGFEEVTGTLLANHPYVIITEDNGQLLCATETVVPEFIFSDNDAKKLNPVSSVAGSTSTFTMGGTMRYIDGADAEGLYIMQGKDANGVCTWKQIEDAYGSYTDVNHRYCVLPMRAYIKSGDALSRQFISSTFTKGVSEMQPMNSGDTDSLYDLLGRKINNAPQRKGVYIRNGRKVIINKN